jgi:hypothetical protein
MALVEAHVRLAELDEAGERLGEGQAARGVDAGVELDEQRGGDGVVHGDGHAEKRGVVATAVANEGPPRQAHLGGEPGRDGAVAGLLDTLARLVPGDHPGGAPVRGVARGRGDPGAYGIEVGGRGGGVRSLDRGEQGSDATIVLEARGERERGCAAAQQAAHRLHGDGRLVAHDDGGVGRAPDGLEDGVAATRVGEVEERDRRG